MFPVSVKLLVAPFVSESSCRAVKPDLFRREFNSNAALDYQRVQLMVIACGVRRVPPDSS